MITDIDSLEKPSFGFWKDLFFIVIFFTITPITLGISLYSIFSLEKNEKQEYVQNQRSGVRVYASLPREFPSVLGVATVKDARSEIVKQYLERYNSPIAEYSEYIVQMADKYGLDFRLVTAIARQESNLCKIIPFGSFNCWGWGIHSKGTLGFTSFEEGIEIVTAGLKREYIDKGFNTPEEIMSKYTPSSDGSWASAVSTFMSEME